MNESTTALATRSGAHVAAAPPPALEPQTFEEAWRFAEIVAKSDLAPKDYKGKPGNILVAVQMGQAIGMPAMQALQSIAVINGMPSLWGDGLLGTVRASAVCEWIKEYSHGAGDDFGWTCEAKRVGDPNVVKNTFTVRDAKASGLWSKQGPWKLYPSRMLKMRARSWTCRDAFADVLKGLKSAEEVLDVSDETRDAIRNAPTRRDAVKIALQARAPRRVGEATVTAVASEPPAGGPPSSAAPQDPDFATAPAQQLRDWIDQLAIDNGVEAAELSEIVRAHGGFRRSTLPAIVEAVRGRGAPPPAEEEPAAVGELVEETDEIGDELE